MKEFLSKVPAPYCALPPSFLFFLYHLLPRFLQTVQRTTPRNAKRLTSTQTVGAHNRMCRFLCTSICFCLCTHRSFSRAVHTAKFLHTNLSVDVTHENIKSTIFPQYAPRIASRFCIVYLFLKNYLPVNN